MERVEVVSYVRLIEVLAYEPKTGRFMWRIGKRAGQVAGSLDRYGYRRIQVDSRCYRAHRLAWFYMNGRWPVGDVDHRFGMKDDNRIAELRDVSEAENSQNQRNARSDSKTGYLGVTQLPNGKFQASIKVDDRSIYLGSFDTPEDAHGAYVEAKRLRHKGGTL